MSEPESAVLVRVSLPLGLARIREEWHPAVALGIPAHVTLLYPFVPRRWLTPRHRAALVDVLAGQRAFDVRFVAAHRWPGAIVYLAPDPADVFRALTERIAARWPEHPPYRGVLTEVIPHLTLVANEGAPLDAVRAAAELRLPFAARVRAVEVLAEGDDGRWRRKWRLALRP
jgi:hypothetical protein